MSLQQQINNLWTTADLCERFNVTPMAIFYWRRDKALPVITVPSEGRPAIRFEPKQIRAWARKHGYKLTDRTVAA